MSSQSSSVRMRTFFAKEIVAGLIAITIVNPAFAMAGDGNLTSWQNLQQLDAGQEIAVTKTDGGAVRGTFVGFADQSISLKWKQQDITITRTDISLVRLRSARGRRYTWIGAALGAGAGAGVGAGIGEHVAYESGGDFRNLKPAIIGVCAGIGALAGAAVGSAIGSRHTTIYTAK
jgi:hypothetical protein